MGALELARAAAGRGGVGAVVEVVLMAAMAKHRDDRGKAPGITLR